MYTSGGSASTLRASQVVPSGGDQQERATRRQQGPPSGRRSFVDEQCHANRRETGKCGDISDDRPTFSARLSGGHAPPTTA